MSAIYYVMNTFVGGLGEVNLNHSHLSIACRSARTFRQVSFVHISQFPNYITRFSLPDLSHSLCLQGGGLFYNVVSISV
jgi:hypothetical protein